MRNSENMLWLKGSGITHLSNTLEPVYVYHTQVKPRANYLKMYAIQSVCQLKLQAKRW